MQPENMKLITDCGMVKCDVMLAYYRNTELLRQPQVEESKNLEMTRK